MILLNFDEHDAYIDREEFNTDNSTIIFSLKKKLRTDIIDQLKKSKANNIFLFKNDKKLILPFIYIYSSTLNSHKLHNIHINILAKRSNATEKIYFLLILNNLILIINILLNTSPIN